MNLNKLNPHTAIEDYLETIYELELTKKNVRVTDIAEKLKIKKASVSEMVKKLALHNYIIYQRYQPIKLSAKGRKIGRDIHEKHLILEEFFDLIQVPKQIQLQDILGLEHYLSNQSLKQIKKLCQALKTQNFKLKP